MSKSLSEHPDIIDCFFSRCKKSYDVGSYGRLMQDRDLGLLISDTLDRFRQNGHDPRIISSYLRECQQQLFKYFEEKRSRSRTDMWFWLTLEEQKEITRTVEEAMISKALQTT